MKKILLVVALAVVSTGVQAQKIDSCRYYRLKCDTLQHKLYMQNMRVEKVKRYLKICQKNPSQSKFLKGWVTRAVK